MLRLLHWLLEQHPGYQLLREKLTLMSDRALAAERKIDALEEKLELSRRELVAEKDKWIEYVAVITNRPPVSGSREWFEQQRAAVRETQKQEASEQAEMLNAMRQSQLAREKARAAFEQQLPAFVDEKYQEADKERLEYFKLSEAADMARYFDEQLSGSTQQSQQSNPPAMVFTVEEMGNSNGSN